MQSNFFMGRQTVMYIYRICAYDDFPYSVGTYWIVHWDWGASKIVRRCTTASIEHCVSKILLIIEQWYLTLFVPIGVGSTPHSCSTWEWYIDRYTTTSGVWHFALQLPLSSFNVWTHASSTRNFQAIFHPNIVKEPQCLIQETGFVEMLKESKVKETFLEGRSWPVSCDMMRSNYRSWTRPAMKFSERIFIESVPGPCSPQGQVSERIRGI